MAEKVVVVVADCKMMRTTDYSDYLSHLLDWPR